MANNTSDDTYTGPYPAIDLDGASVQEPVRNISITREQIKAITDGNFAEAMSFEPLFIEAATAINNEQPDNFPQYILITVTP